ncbi:MAG: thiamine phosphate synthase [Hyphomicrobiaceae bacterium]|nr:thiamine phosphate synthase [Hyphomicrobiaceae bacterium]MCC0008710.1 thiamine phosphate synthase [Hyphomicrobiaceae bacterium]
MWGSVSGLDVFYPILPDSAWIARAVPLGIRTVQLRLKDADDAEVRRQIAQARDVCRDHRCQLIVNDYWQAAIELGCDYIHLGQEDLAAADVAAIKKAGVRLGISTHSEDELEIALAASPDYIALGPIWETKLKAMKWAPQGLERIARWRQRIGKVPLVAIGGITPERAPDVIASGADSVAVITDFMTAPDPVQRIGMWIDWASSARG